MSASGRHSGRGRGPYGARCPWCTAHAARGARSLPTVHAHCPWCTLTVRGARSLPVVHGARSHGARSLPTVHAAQSRGTRVRWQR